MAGRKLKDIADACGVTEAITDLTVLQNKPRLPPVLDIFFYLLCCLFGRFICSKAGLQLSVDRHIILFDERHRAACWRGIRLAYFPEPDSSLGLRIFAVCTRPSPPILLRLAFHGWRIRF
jgi:hypothetical protein